MKIARKEVKRGNKLRNISETYEKYNVFIIRPFFFNFAVET